MRVNRKRNRAGRLKMDDPDPDSDSDFDETKPQTGIVYGYGNEESVHVHSGANSMEHPAFVGWFRIQLLIPNS